VTAAERQVVGQTNMHAVRTRTMAMITITILVGPAAGNAAPSGPPAGEIISTLKRSVLPLATGGEDCRGLAEHHPTLGALVTAYEKLANGERIATCRRVAKDRAALSCRAQFSNRVPPPFARQLLSSTSGIIGTATTEV
jgi:hypothetical protein